MHPAIASAAAVVGASAVILGFSEFIFFNEEPAFAMIGAASPADLAATTFAMLAFYLLPGAMLVALQPLMTTWARVLLGGAIVGWVIEASIVNIAYENIPFSFAWPPITWHAIVDVLFGCFVLRIALRARAVVAVATALALGIAWGVWTTWPWPEVRVTPDQFARLSAETATLVAVGLWLLDRAPADTGLNRWVAWTVVALCLALGAAQMLPFLPIGASFAVVVALDLWALRRARPGEGPLVKGPRPPLWRYALPFLSAGVAWYVYAEMWQAGIGFPTTEWLPFLIYASIAWYLWVLVRSLLGR